MVVWNLSVIVDCVMCPPCHSALHCASASHYHGILARIFHSPRAGTGARGRVAQVSNLLYHRLPVGRLYVLAGACGLEIRDTAGSKPALRLPFGQTCEISRLGASRNVKWFEVGCCPGGTSDNSPTFFNVGGRCRGCRVPQGRLSLDPVPSAVPAGLAPFLRVDPNVETLGYYQVSLRDNAGPLQRA